MELWYTEEHSPNVRFSIKVNKHIYSAQSEYQRIDVMEAEEFGRFFTLDSLMMLTEKDEFIYHEMITHVPMAVNPNIKNVLVIGGGDGGTVRELTRYKEIKNIELVEIDKLVVDVCKEYFKSTASCLKDKRVNIYYEDGLRYIRNKNNEYDLIIVDSTDPFGPGEGLFTKEFYGCCYRALNKNGILVNQHESPYYKIYSDSLQNAHARLKAFFPITMLYQAHIPTYPSGYWLFGFSSKGLNPIKDFDAKRWNNLLIETNYYNTNLHVGCFQLPTYVNKLLENSHE